MEIELKYSIDEEAVASEIFQDPYIEMIKDKQTEEKIPMHAIYFDTADYKLHDEGIAFRVRREGDVLQATLKWNGSTEGGMHRRAELNVPVTDEGLLDTPTVAIFEQSEMGEVLKNLVGSSPLTPMMEVQVVRHQVRVDTGKSICELSVDKGEVRCAGKKAPILEMEVELLSGDEEDMRTLGEDLAIKFGLRPESISKFKRGLDLMEESK